MVRSNQYDIYFDKITITTTADIDFKKCIIDVRHGNGFVNVINSNTIEYIAPHTRGGVHPTASDIDGVIGVTETSQNQSTKFYIITQAFTMTWYDDTHGWVLRDSGVYTNIPDAVVQTDRIISNMIDPLKLIRGESVYQAVNTPSADNVSISQIEPTYIKFNTDTFDRVGRLESKAIYLTFKS